ncbi:sigma-54-dependent Fis family transcriptional regulator, partial [candidate division KSB1 bacterium]|nr:sigma-54-dependent Fis family transcriptional regulator [candidate division KSB1 bacterium]
MKKRILVVDDEESVRYSFNRFLNEAIFTVILAKSGMEALSIFKPDSFDLVVLDIRLPDISGLDVLRKIKKIDPKAVVLIMTAFGTTEIAIEAIKLGAYDYILKPFDIPAMKRLIEEALRCSHILHHNVVLESNAPPQTPGDRLVGKSAIMQEVYKMIGRVAGSDVNVLIRGESGTGKEL